MWNGGSHPPPPPTIGMYPAKTTTTATTTPNDTEPPRQFALPHRSTTGNTHSSSHRTSGHTTMMDDQLHMDAISALTSLQQGSGFPPQQQQQPSPNWRHNSNNNWFIIIIRCWHRAMVVPRNQPYYRHRTYLLPPLRLVLASWFIQCYNVIIRRIIPPPQRYPPPPHRRTLVALLMTTSITVCSIIHPIIPRRPCTARRWMGVVIHPYPQRYNYHHRMGH